MRNKSLLPKNKWQTGMITLLFALGLMGTLTTVQAEGEKQVIAGAGPSTAIVNEFVKLLGKGKEGAKYNFVVPQESAKHSGGLRSAQQFIFGRTGRPLNDEEKKEGFGEIYLSKMPIAFVKGSKVTVGQLTKAQLCGLFSGQLKSWNEVGGPDHEVVIFTRETTEAVLTFLKADLPCLDQTIETKFVFKKDTALAKALANDVGDGYAIGFGALENFQKEQIIQISDYSAVIRLGLVYAKENANHPLIQEARDWVKSADWKAMLQQLGLESPE